MHGRNAYMEATRRPDLAAPVASAVRVRYRPMNQALPFSSCEMINGGFATALPAVALTGEYPPAYAFEVRGEAGAAWRRPGLGGSLSCQPNVVAWATSR